MGDNTKTESASPAAMSSSPSPVARRRSYVWLAALILAGFLTANMWLLFSQLKDMRKHSRQQAFWALCHPGSTAAARADCFLKLAAEGNTEWRSAILSKLSLPGVDLSGVRLERARFTAGDFQEATFDNADLTDAHLDLSDLTNASFANAKLRSTTFFKSRLSEADFHNADLLSASLEQCTAHNANFVSARMGDAFMAMADFSGSNLTGADLTGANLEAAILRDTDLALAGFHATRLADADFTDSNWWRALGFTSVQLDELTLTFPPTANAPESRQRDFEFWLTRRMVERERPESEDQKP